MNGLLIAVLVILIGAVFIGYRRGFVRIAFSLVAMLLTIVLVSLATPHVTSFLKDHTGVYESLTEKCTQAVQLSAQKNAEEQQDSLKGEQEVSGIQLPALWVDQILEKTGSSIDHALEESGAYRAVGEYLADWILRGIAFFVAFILVSIVLRLVVGLLDILTKLPVIKGVNHLLGGAAGLLQGLLIIWMLLFLVAIACTTRLGQTMLDCIGRSAFLTFLYQHNGLLYFFNLVFH